MNLKNLLDNFILFDDDFPIFDDYIFNDSDSFIKAKELKTIICNYITELSDPLYFFLHNKTELLNILLFI